MIQKNSGVVFFVLGTKKIVKVVGGNFKFAFEIFVSRLVRTSFPYTI